MSTASKSTHRSSLALNLFEIPLKEDGSEAFTRRQRRSKVTADIDRIFIENSFKSSKEHQQRQRVKHQILEYAAKSVSLSDGDQREDTAHRPDRRSFEDLVAAEKSQVHPYSRVAQSLSKGERNSKIKEFASQGRIKSRRTLPPIDNKQASVVVDDDSPLPISVKYVNLPSLSYQPESPISREYYLRAVQSILMRESLLIRISRLIEDIDDSYWTYTTSKIIEINRKNKQIAHEATEKDFSELSLIGSTDDRAVSFIHTTLQRLQSLQKELSVAIAHFRGLTINVVESIFKWRNVISSDYLSSDAPSIYWNQTNYLMKILQDYKLFQESEIISEWLTFEANAFMLPCAIKLPKRSDGSLVKLQIEECRGYSSFGNVRLPLLMRYRLWMKRKKDLLIKAKYQSESRMKSLGSFARASSSTSVSISSIMGDHHLSFAYHTGPLPPLVEAQSPTAETLHHQGMDSPPTKLTSVGNDSVKDFPSTNQSPIEKADSIAISIDDDSESRLASPSQSSVGFVSSVGDLSAAFSEEGVVLSRQTTIQDLANGDQQPSFREGYFMNDNSINGPFSRKPFASEVEFTRSKSRSSSLELTPGFVPKALSDWTILRDYCRRSRQNQFSNENVVNEFWEDTRHHPLVVAAAAGLKETLPEESIVPSLPDELIQASIEAWNHCIDEFNSVCAYETRMREERTISEDDLKARLSNVMATNHIDLSNHLKKNQLNVDGLSRDHHQITSLLSSGVLSRASVAAGGNIDEGHLQEQNKAELLTPKAIGFSVKDFFAMTSIQNASQMLFSNPLKATTTSTNTMLKKEDISVISSDSDSDDSSILSLSRFSSRLPTATNSHRPSYVMKRLSTEESQRLIQLAAIERVESRRRLTMKVNGIATLCVEQFMKLHPLSNQRKNFLATKIQCMIRRFLANMKLKRLQRLQRVMKMVIKIQKTTRGFFVRKRLRAERLRLKIDTMMYRKIIAKKFRAAIVITNALRSYAIQRRQENTNEAEGEGLRSSRTGGVLSTDDENLGSMYIGRRKVRNYLFEQITLPPIETNQTSSLRKRQSVARSNNELIKDECLGQSIDPLTKEDSTSSEQVLTRDVGNTKIEIKPVGDVTTNEEAKTLRKSATSLSMLSANMRSASCLLPQRSSDKGRIIRYKPFLMKDKRAFVRDPKVHYSRQCEFKDVYDSMRRFKQSISWGSADLREGVKAAVEESELCLQNYFETHRRSTS